MECISHLTPNYARLPVKFVRGEGARLYDEEGKEYIDLLSGIGVNSLGYAHPKLTKAVCEQASKLIHISNLFEVPYQEELAQKLVETSYRRGKGKVFFANSGAEANEALIKLIRKYWRDRGEDRYEIITFKGSFHGRTYGSLSATGQPKLQEGFEPILPGFVYAKFNDIESVKKLISEKTAAILLEVIQGEGGVNPAQGAFMEALYRLTRKAGILLAIDEVQTGNGRTGKYWGFQHYGIVPDLFSTAKGLGGGIPVGALVAKSEIAESLTAGSHGSTFGGNPLAMRAGLVVYEELENGLLNHVTRVGEFFKEGLKSLGVGKVKGKGLMLGMELDKPCKDLVLKGVQKGVVFNCTAQRVLRFLPPLVITQEELERALEILKEILL
ncbi:MAG TPA: aspartate aminotransferase family protein [Aquifex aeolicus]|uniref:Acetylornithine aminotransferase n=1 Tax=Aquifex aeolicus TaxID=63363 RepID=A0A9D0YPU2_AQUAO|nr:aspartate aminotransferase family protein [Aquifex aeolicus]